MRIYSNSSYKYSPTGFAIGYVELSDLSNNNYSYLKVCKDDTIRKLFEAGEIKSVYGKLPGSDKYVYLVKKLECSFKNDDNVDSKKYGNFAFVFDNSTEYIRFKSNYDSKSLIKSMNEFIVPDGSVEKFGLKIQNSSLHKFIQDCLKDCASNISDDCLYIDTTSVNSDISKKLSDLLSVSVSKESGFTYCTKKKQSIAVPIIASVIAVAAVAIVAALVVTITSSNKNEKNNQATNNQNTILVSTIPSKTSVKL